MLLETFRFNQKRINVQENRILELETRVTNLLKVRDQLEDENHELKSTNKQLKREKERQDEEIAHNLKLREGEIDLKYRRDVQQKEGEKQEAIAKVKDEYRDKVESHLEKRGNELKEMYNEILKHLSPVAAAIAKAEAKASKDK